MNLLNYLFQIHLYNNSWCFLCSTVKRHLYFCVLMFMVIRCEYSALEFRSELINFGTTYIYILIHKGEVVLIMNRWCIFILWNRKLETLNARV